jgi:hypothetical protein
MTGGDGAGGLAIVIGLVMAAIVAAGLVTAVLLGRLLARRLNLSTGGTALTIVALGLAGLGAGGLIIAATFFESTFSPPPTVRFNLPAGFAHKWVILLEDPTATRELPWRGFEGPFSGVRANVEVPASGVIRLRDFGRMSGRADSVMVWSDGSDTTGGASGPAPAGLNATSYMMFERGDKYDPPSQAPDSVTLINDVRRREAATQVK